MDTNALTRALEKFAEIDYEMQLPAMLAFLFVAHRGKVSQRILEDNLKMSNSAASRNVSYWTDRRFDRKPGVGFIQREEDDHDRRLKNLMLTPSGQKFFDELRGMNYGKTVQDEVDG